MPTAVKTIGRSLDIGKEAVVALAGLASLQVGPSADVDTHEPMDPARKSNCLQNEVSALSYLCQIGPFFRLKNASYFTMLTLLNSILDTGSRTEIKYLKNQGNIW